MDKQEMNCEQLPPAYSPDIIALEPGLPVLPSCICEIQPAILSKNYKNSRKSKKQNSKIAPFVGDMLSVSEVTTYVFVLDDSGSMKTKVNIPTQCGRFCETTRCEEQYDSARITFNLIKKKCPTSKIDIYFLNGVEPFLDVKNKKQLNRILKKTPGGGTPLFTTLKKIYDKYKHSQTKISITVWTDGVPDQNDGTLADTVFRMFYPNNKTIIFGICIVLCTDEQNVVDLYGTYDEKYPLEVYDDYYSQIKQIYEVQKTNEELSNINKETYFGLILTTQWCPELDSLNEKPISEEKLYEIADRFCNEHSHVSHEQIHFNWFQRIFVCN